MGRLVTRRHFFGPSHVPFSRLAIGSPRLDVGRLVHQIEKLVGSRRCTCTLEFTGIPRQLVGTLGVAVMESFVIIEQQSLMFRMDIK